MPTLPQGYTLVDKEPILNTIADTEIRPSAIHRNGLFTLKKINKGEVLALLDGQHIPWKIYSDFNLDTEWNAISEDMLLVRFVKTKYFFINHSRTPNLKIQRNPIGIIALRDLEINTELTLDYRDEPLPEKYINGHGKTYL